MRYAQGRRPEQRWKVIARDMNGLLYVVLRDLRRREAERDAERLANLSWVGSVACLEEVEV